MGETGYSSHLEQRLITSGAIPVLHMFLRHAKERLYHKSPFSDSYFLLIFLNNGIKYGKMGLEYM